ncbi:hypothetical protein BC936DRAFT_140719 [Jimgerdemannia flammicorona]|uniref:Uncharacterized protein n=1 Tax=Jimgerdemannia flammicorona TaxID=994334 RepID=A0A433ADL0_9FUNG|nr:hypothetical protein BC936DRAFT_140719 [Jimgerdemannia flammicorona]
MPSSWRRHQGDEGPERNRLLQEQLPRPLDQHHPDPEAHHRGRERVCVGQEVSLIWGGQWKVNKRRGDEKTAYTDGPVFWPYLIDRSSDFLWYF